MDPDSLSKFLKQRQTECLFGWYNKRLSGVNVFHNCKLKKGHKGKHKCLIKYRGTPLEAKCKSWRAR